MANPDNPKGFELRKIIGGSTGAFETFPGKSLSNTIITNGDALMAAAGYCALTNIASTDGIVGVSASRQTTSVTTNQDIALYPALQNYIFSGQCSGTPTQATVWTNCDIEGTTGIMEINEDATSLNVVKVVGLLDSSSMGLNAELLFQWNKSLWAQIVPS